MATMPLKGVMLLVIVGVVAVGVLLPAVTAMDYMVGEGDGWRPGYNYTYWTMGKEFRVGDSLVFMYPKGKHNVYKVTGPEFKDCTVPNNGPALDSGSDTVHLATEGKKWYLCGVKDHCKKGQKLVINVLAALPAAPAPSPSADASAPTSGDMVAASPRVALAAAAAALAAITAFI
uniref:Blue copper protein n=1 Tax=Anthurium amnicola TaxID=1678845 RepID=A0A1D1XKN9_9ARAE